MPAGWNVRFGRELNATDDRPHFVPSGRRARSRCCRSSKASSSRRFRSTSIAPIGIPIGTAARLLDRAATFERSRIAYRDVASATNKLTLIAAMLPRGTVSTHTVFCLKTALDERSQWCLLGLLNSFVANYLVRLQVTTHVTTALMSRLPVPQPARDSRAFDRLVALAKRIAKRGIGTIRAPTTPSSTQSPPSCTAITPDQYAFILDSFPLIQRKRFERMLASLSRTGHGSTEARKQLDQNASRTTSPTQIHRLRRSRCIRHWARAWPSSHIRRRWRWR